MVRDEKVRIQLQKMGWRVIVIWECEIQRNNDELLMRLFKDLGISDRLYLKSNNEEFLKVAEE